MATPDSYRSICEKFCVGRATALYAVKRVIKALINLAPLFITWPEDNKRNKEIFMGFAMISAFPKVIGAIDGTHINIRAPHINAECYVNRKGQHSIQLQVICLFVLEF
ncbi:putative nuclease HARBI1 [Formica fusca]